MIDAPRGVWLMKEEVEAVAVEPRSRGYRCTTELSRFHRRDGRKPSAA